MLCFKCALRLARKQPPIPCTCRSPRTLRDRVRDITDKLRKEEFSRPAEEIKLTKGGAGPVRHGPRMVDYGGAQYRDGKRK